MTDYPPFYNGTIEIHPYGYWTGSGNYYSIPEKEPTLKKMANRYMGSPRYLKMQQDANARKRRGKL